MRILFKTLRNSEDLIRVFNFCEAYGIETLHDGSSLVLDDIQLEETRVVINWGGYGSAVSIGKNLFNYFSLTFPDGNPPRGKTFSYVKMVITGTLENHDADEVTQLVENLGGSIVKNVDDTVNLLVVGKQANAKLVRKAEKLNQVLILDEARFGEILPAKRKVPAKQKVKPRNAVAVPEAIEKRALINLKKLLATRDFKRIDQGLELLRSLGNADIHSYFLDGVTYTPQGEGSLIPNSMFRGTGPAQPYLNYALLGVIAYAPEACEPAANLKKSITRLGMVLGSTGPLAEFNNLESLDLTGSEELENLNGLSPLKQLKQIKVRGCRSLQNVDGLANSTKFKNLDLGECDALQNLDGLAGCTALTSLDLSGCNSLQNMDGLINCTKLTKLNLDLHWSNTLQNVNGLANCTKLAKLDLSNCQALQNVDGLEGCTNLTSLNLTSCASLQDVDGLANLKKLTELDLSACDSLQNVDGLANFTGLIQLDLSHCESLQNLDGLANSTKFKNLDLRVCGALQNLDGLAGCTILTSLDLSDCISLQNVNGLANCTKLAKLDLSNCQALQDVDGLESCTKLTSLNLASCTSLQNIDGLVNCTKFILGKDFGKKLDLTECGSLQNVNGLANCTKLRSLDLSGCASLVNIDGLAGCTKLTELNLTGCGALRNVSGLETAKLKQLDIAETELKTLNNLTTTNVKSLTFDNLKMSSFKGLNKWQSVTTLAITQDSGEDVKSAKKKTFVDLDGIEAFPNLETLHLGGRWSDACDKLKSLKGIEKLDHLRELDLTECSAIRDLSPIAELQNLSRLMMDGCTQASPLPRPKVMESPDLVKNYQARLLKALGKAVPEPPSKVSKKGHATVDHKTISKIKKFLTKRDIDSINQGVELARALENQALFEELLKEVRYDKDAVDHRDYAFVVEQPSGALIPNKLFTGTGPAQPYLDCAMIGLLNHASNDFATELQKEVKTLNSSCCLTEYYSNFTNIKKLRIYLDSNLPWEEQSLWHTPSLNGLSTLDRLTHLQIACGPKSDQNLQALSKCNNLVELALGKLESLKSLSGLEECGKLQIIELSECTVLENIDALRGHDQLKSLQIHNADALRNLNGLKGCVALEELNIVNAESLENLDGLKGLKALKTINIDDAKSLESLDGLNGCVSLKELTIRGSYDARLPAKDIDGLKGLKALERVTLSGFHSLVNINGFKGCSSLEDLELSECDSLSNIDGLKKMKALTSVRICAKTLKNVDGLSGCENLNDFSFEGEALENIDGLKGCHRIEKLDIPQSSKLQNLDALVDMKKLREIHFSRCNIKKLTLFTIEVPTVKKVLIENCDKLTSLEGFEQLINLAELRVRQCPMLATLKGLEETKRLQLIIVDDCGSLKNVDSLLNLSKLETFKIHSCGIKKANLPAPLQVIVETRTSYQDW